MASSTHPHRDSLDAHDGTHFYCVAHERLFTEHESCGCVVCEHCGDEWTGDPDTCLCELCLDAGGWCDWCTKYTNHAELRYVESNDVGTRFHACPACYQAAAAARDARIETKGGNQTMATVTIELEQDELRALVSLLRSAAAYANDAADAKWLTSFAAKARNDATALECEAKSLESHLEEEPPTVRAPMQFA